MATIALYASQINQMPGLINNVKKSVTDYNSELSALRSRTLTINQSVCNMDEIISSIQTSTQTQEQKIAALDSFSQNMEQFISDVVRIDSDVADVINQLKNDFYTQYNHLKPESEKGIFEKIGDGLEAAWEWCKEHWKLIVTIVLVIVAVVLICTGVGGPFAAIILGACKGLIAGAISGGLIGGFSSLAAGGSFWEGFENGAFSGALTGALFGGLGAGGQMFGQAFGHSCRAFDIIGAVAKVSGVLSTGMTVFDLAAWGAGLLFGQDNFLTTFNARLHESTAYNIFQFGVSAVAVFSGSAYRTMKPMPKVCFVAGTMIATINGLVAIENIKEGDKVLSTNTDTFETTHKSVLDTYIRKTSLLIHVWVDGKKTSVTPNHPYWVIGKGWVNAGELSAGDQLRKPEGDLVSIQRIEFEELKTSVTVYNFEVEDFHTYYAGDISVLVHNANCKYEVLDDGSVDITDWGDYPEGYPKPSGKGIRLIDGDEYTTAQRQGYANNRVIHDADASLKGMDIHHVTPIKFGGHPTDPSNLIPLSRPEHAILTTWWRELQRQLENL